MKRAKIYFSFFLMLCLAISLRSLDIDLLRSGLVDIAGSRSNSFLEYENRYKFLFKKCPDNDKKPFMIFYCS